MPKVSHWLPDCISWALLAVTGAGLRWKSLKKQESVQARTTWRRSNVAFSVAHFELQFFLVFRAYSPHRVSPSSPSYFYKKKKKKRWSFFMKHQHPHHRIQHPREYHSLLVTATAVWHLIGNLKWNLLLPSEATSSSFSLCSGSFPSFSLGLDVSNLPLRNPQQRNKWFR